MPAPLGREQAGDRRACLAGEGGGAAEVLEAAFVVVPSELGSAPVQGGFAGESAGHEVDHREVDHGFGAVRVAFVVAGEASVGTAVGGTAVSDGACCVA